MAEVEPVKIGDRVRRIGQDSNGRQEGIVLAIEDQPRPRIQVEWEAGRGHSARFSARGATTWVALAAEGKRWERIPNAQANATRLSPERLDAAREVERLLQARKRGSHG